MSYNCHFFSHILGANVLNTSYSTLSRSLREPPSLPCALLPYKHVSTATGIAKPRRSNQVQASGTGNAGDELARKSTVNAFGPVVDSYPPTPCSTQFVQMLWHSDLVPENMTALAVAVSCHARPCKRGTHEQVLQLHARKTAEFCSRSQSVVRSGQLLIDRVFTRHVPSATASICRIPTGAQR